MKFSIRKVLCALQLTLLVCFLGQTSSIASEIRVLANQSPPFCALVGGKPAGVATEILSALSDAGGPAFSYDFSYPWARAQYEVERSPDLTIIPLTRTPEREEKFKWIAKLFQYQFHFFSTGERALSVEDARPLTIGVLRGTAIIPVLEQMGFKNLYDIKDEESAVKMLSGGRIDAWITSEMVARYQWSALEPTAPALKMSPPVGQVYEVYLGAGRAFPDADVNKIRNAIKKLQASGRIDTIISRYKTGKRPPGLLPKN